MDSLSDHLPLIARFLIGFYYVFFGLWNVYHWTPILQVMIQRRIPLPWVTLQAGILLQIITGGMIMTGMFAGFAALLLLPFTVMAVFIFHPFWHHRAEQFRLHFAVFTANLTVGVGALLMIIGGS